LCDTLGRTFHTATALRFGLLLAAALLTVGRRTLANVLRSSCPFSDGEQIRKVAQLTERGLNTLWAWTPLSS